MARRRKTPDGVRHPAASSNHGLSRDEAAVMEVMQLPPYSRERDMALVALSYEQLKMYMELHCIPGHVEVYRESTRGHWQYIDKHPEIYSPDGTTHWGRGMEYKA